MIARARLPDAFYRSTWLWRAGLLLSLGGCATPIPQYPLAHLLPPNYAALLASRQSLDLAASPLCQGLGTRWDSVLVVKPYVPAATVAALPLANYAAVRPLVRSQNYGDFTCTLLFVKAGRYVAYSVVPRTVDFAALTKQPANPLVWLTPHDRAQLSLRRSAQSTPADSAREYTVVLAAHP
jgi:hypothetical protein